MQRKNTRINTAQECQIYRIECKLLLFTLHSNFNFFTNGKTKSTQRSNSLLFHVTGHLFHGGECWGGGAVHRAVRRRGGEGTTQLTGRKPNASQSSVSSKPTLITQTNSHGHLNNTSLYENNTFEHHTSAGLQLRRKNQRTRPTAWVTPNKNRRKNRIDHQYLPFFFPIVRNISSCVTSRCMRRHHVTPSTIIFFHIIKVTMIRLHWAGAVALPRCCHSVISHCVE